jgi:hypothetical protein
MRIRNPEHLAHKCLKLSLLLHNFDNLKQIQGNRSSHGKNEKHVQKNILKIFSIIIFPSQYNAFLTNFNGSSNPNKNRSIWIGIRNPGVCNI